MSPCPAASESPSAPLRGRSARVTLLLAVLSACVAPCCQIDHRSLIQESLENDGGSEEPATGGDAHAKSGAAGAGLSSAGAEDNLGGSSGEANGGESGDSGDAGRSDASGGVTSQGGTSGSGGVTSPGGTSGSGGTGGNANGGSSANGGTSTGGSSANGGAGRTAAGGAASGASSVAGAAPVLCPDLDADSISDCSETLLKNATFDASFSGAPNNWHVDAGATATWNSLDATSSNSGSVVVTTSATTGDPGLDQCIPIQAGKSYEAFALMLIQATANTGLARMSELFYPSSDCSGNVDRVVPSAPDSTLNSWRTLHVPASPAMSDGSLLLRLEVLKADGAASMSVNFDSVLLFGK